MRTGLIMLAAGCSRRFGENKLLYPLEGKPMYLHLLERLAAVCAKDGRRNLFVVSRYEEILRKTEELGGQPVFGERERGRDRLLHTGRSGKGKGDGRMGFFRGGSAVAQAGDHRTVSPKDGGRLLRAGMRTARRAKRKSHVVYPGVSGGTDGAGGRPGRKADYSGP